MFKIFHTYTHGSRGYCNQVCENISITHGLNRKRSGILNTMVDFSMLDFINSLNKTNNYDKSCLKQPKIINNVNDLNFSFMDSHFDSTNLNESSICLHNRIGIKINYSKFYAKIYFFN